MNTLRLSLRTWLLLLAALSTLPLLLLSLSVLWSYKTDQQQVLLERLQARSHALAQSVGERLKTAVGTLQGVAESRAALALDIGTLYQHASRVVAHNPDFLAINLIDSQGWQLFTTQLPLAEPRLLGDATDRVTEALRTQAPNVSGPFASPVDPSETVVAVTVPIVRDDQAEHVLRMILTTRSINQLLDQRYLPDQWVAGIADRNGILVARSRQPERFVGTPASVPFRNAMLTHEEQPFANVTVDGIEVRTQMLPVFGADWYLGIGVPTSVLNEPVTALLWRIALVAALWMSLSVLATRAFAGYLTQQMRNVTQVFEGGHMAVPEGKTIRIQELWDIVQHYWQARHEESAARSHLSTMALERDEVQDLYDHAPCGYHSLNEDGRYLRVNQTELDWLGLPREQVVGRPFTDFLTEDSQATFKAEFAQFIHNGWIKNLELEMMRGSGTPMPVLVSATAIKDEAGRLISTRTTVYDNTEHKMMEAQLERLARTDMLTALSNRRDFYEQAERAIAHSRRYGTPLCLFMLDIDFFKRINDTYGHAGGDDVLRKLSRSLGDALRDTDVPARLGGEEFAVLMPSTPLDQAVRVAERLRATLAQIVVQVADGQEIRFTVSIGVTAWAPGDASLDATLHRADEALYRAKHQGRNRVEVATAADDPPAAPLSPSPGERA